MTFLIAIAILSSRITAETKIISRGDGEASNLRISAISRLKKIRALINDDKKCLVMEELTKVNLEALHKNGAVGRIRRNLSSCDFVYGNRPHT